MNAAPPFLVDCVVLAVAAVLVIYLFSDWFEENK